MPRPSCGTRRTSRGATPNTSASTGAGTRRAGSAGSCGASSSSCSSRSRWATRCASRRRSSAIGGSGRGGSASAGSRTAAWPRRVTTDWVLLDSRNRVVRIPADFGLAFTNPEIHSEIIRVPAPGGAPARAIDVRVRVSELDPLDHVNNAAYVDWLDEALHAAGWGAATRLPRTVRIEYLASAERGDDVTVELRGDATQWAALIKRSDGLELVRACRRRPGANVDG